VNDKVGSDSVLLVYAAGSDTTTAFSLRVNRFYRDQVPLIGNLSGPDIDGAKFYGGIAKLAVDQPRIWVWFSPPPIAREDTVATSLGVNKVNLQLGQIRLVTATVLAMSISGWAVGGALPGPGKTAVKCPTASIEIENKHIAENYLKALGAGDMDTIRNLLADDAQWIVPQDPSLSPVAGAHDRADLLKLIGNFKRRIPNGVTFTVIGMTAEGERVAVEATSQADTVVGPFHNQYHFLFVIRQGKIVIGKEYLDSLLMQNFRTREADRLFMQNAAKSE
jgi:ketosteroid isomerase-like protein